MKQHDSKQRDGGGAQVMVRGGAHRPRCRGDTRDQDPHARPVITQTGPLVLTYRDGTARLAVALAACTTVKNRPVN